MKNVTLREVVLTLFVIVGLTNLALATTTDELLLESGASAVLVTDNGVGDTNPANGIINYSNANFDGWNIGIAGGSTNSPTAAPLGIDIFSFTATCASGGGCAKDALLIAYSDINFVTPVLAFADNFSGVAATGSASQIAFDDASNGIFGTTTAIGGALGPFGPGPFSASATGGGPAGPSAYSLTLADIVTAGSTGVSLDGSTTAVPEPGTLTLLGSGLVGLAGLLRRRARA